MVNIESSIVTLLKNSAERLKEIFGFDNIPEIVLDVPRESAFGDLATNIALQIGHQIQHPAKEIAHIMIDQMKPSLKKPPYSDIIEKIEVGAPEFINFFLAEFDQVSKQTVDSCDNGRK